MLGNDIKAHPQKKSQTFGWMLHIQSSPLDNIEHNYANSIKITPAADRRDKTRMYYVIILVPPYGS